MDFLGIRCGDIFLAGLNGTYQLGQPSLDAHIHLLEVDLSKIPSGIPLLDSIEKLQIGGKIKGKGALHLHKKPQQGWIAGVNLDVSTHEIAWQGYRLENANHVAMEFSSEKGWSISNLNSGFIIEPYGGKAAFHLKQLQYENETAALVMNDLSFSIDPDRLRWLSQELRRYFPDLMDEKLEHVVMGVKNVTPLRGVLNCQLAHSGQSVHLTLEDGLYNLWGDARDLKELSLSLKQHEWQAVTLYHLNRQPVWVVVELDMQQPDRGKILLAEQRIETRHLPALIITWRKDPDQGIVIEKASGYLAGIHANLIENTSYPTTADAFRLTGSMQINGHLARNIMPTAIFSAFSALEIGNGYQITGELEISKELSIDRECAIRFFGTLGGQEVELKGYQLNQLSSQVVFEPNSVQFLNFTLSDPAGNLHMSNLRIDKQPNGEWWLSVPLVTIMEMRPSLLREVGQSHRLIRKPLVVRELFIQDITGVIGDESSFHSYGLLHFINPQKKNLQNTIFAVPAEILTRIGLNLSVLTPVRGTIHFELQKGKIYLTKFKDVYSDSKISKFYLPSFGAPSTIDLDGNLNIQVRFKQSTLLLKLAELFTINIHGSLKKPLYSLQRQKYLINQEVFTSSTSEENTQ